MKPLSLPLLGLSCMVLGALGLKTGKRILRTPSFILVPSGGLLLLTGDWRTAVKILLVWGLITWIYNR